MLTSLCQSFPLPWLELSETPVILLDITAVSAKSNEGHFTSDIPSIGSLKDQKQEEKVNQMKV